MDSGFTSGQVVKFTGITLRQLQWWDERGIVVPGRQGHRRLYSLEDIAEIAVICDLRHRGFSLQRVRKVVRFLQREMGKRLYETACENSRIHLLTDGKNIFLKDSANSIVDLLKNSRQPILGICLSDTVQHVRAEIGLHGPKPTPAPEPRKPGAASAKAALRATHAAARYRRAQ